MKAKNVESRIVDKRSESVGDNYGEVVRGGGGGIMIGKKMKHGVSGGGGGRERERVGCSSH